MWRMSSPGTYSRCWTNSTENPRKGLLWSPMRSPSTTPRAFSPRASARASTSGCRVIGIRQFEPQRHRGHREEPDREDEESNHERHEKHEKREEGARIGSSSSVFLSCVSCLSW